MTDNQREFHFTDKDFETVRKLIYDHAGIALNQSKKDMVYSRLARRLRATGIATFGAYLKLLESNNETEWQAFTNALTTNLTSFFREQHHFPILAEHAKKSAVKHPLSLWCSASSTGEEPYSMAMTMIETFNSYTPPVQIIATDLDTNVLAKAEAGVYPLDRLEKMSPERLKRFFLKGTGNQEGFARVRPELRNMITFRQLNLLADNWPLRPPFDAIFCRNVMIYFDKPTQLKILERFMPLMRPDGLLFAGHSESFHHAASLFRLNGNTVYQVADKNRAHHA
ncbi:MAG: CheR family methyltransferase [Sulfuricellaceae bacterium]|nr:CheR family methyltransferase [Sulfuricellaceae bacterium]